MVENENKETPQIDENKELRETEQEIMLDLKIKTDELLKKFKKQLKKDRVRM